MKTRIHINQHNIRANSKGGDLPVVAAKTYKENILGNQAIIRDADGSEVARIVYRPDKPLSCGAKCWVETELPVEVS